MRNKLLVFGDSWPAGEELLPGEKTFGEILAEQHGIKFENHSQPMTSIAHMLLQLASAVERAEPTDRAVAIFCLTSVSRSIRFDDSWEPGAWDEIQVKRDDPASTAYYRYIHSNKLDELMASSHVLAMQKICQQHGILDYYVACWASPTFCLPAVDQSRMHPQTLLEMLGSRTVDTVSERFMPCEYIKQGGCHPNQQGHLKIANTISPWIDLTQ